MNRQAHDTLVAHRRNALYPVAAIMACLTEDAPD